MNLRKNLAAKVGALIASLAALVATWGLVHQNPPPSAAADSPVSQATPARSPSRATAPAPVPAAPAKRHTRTHAS